MQIKEKISIIEAILFASGEPIEFDKLAYGADVEITDLHKLVAMLNSDYSDRGSALEVLKLEDSYQLSTKEEFAPYIRSALEAKRTATLSPAAMEALTIIAYNQPVTRSFVEDVRGVDSSGVITNLLEKELIEEAGRLDIPGKPMSFKTTANFLRCFRLSSIQDLPPLPSENSQITFDDVGASGYEAVDEALEE